VSALEAPSLRQLCRYTIARSLFKPTSLRRAIARLGFVQADPMRAPARAQDLILAHRVKDYRAGELERRYPCLAIEETFFVNYGFLPRETLALLHPRRAPRSWDARMQALAQEVPAFVRQHGLTPPQGRAGAFRPWPHQALGRRSECQHASAAGPPLSRTAALWSAAPGRRGQVQEDAKSRYVHAQVDGLLWFWPHGENPVAARHQVDDRLRFLAPFDPVVWDRRRFQLFWGWEYKFAAYVPPTSAEWAITLCPCCGASKCWAGPI
jgi:uncharacterized protein